MILIMNLIKKMRLKKGFVYDIYKQFGGHKDFNYEKCISCYSISHREFGYNGDYRGEYTIYFITMNNVYKA